MSVRLIAALCLLLFWGGGQALAASGAGGEGSGAAGDASGARPAVPQDNRLKLADDEAGFTLALPAGWQRLENEELQERLSATCFKRNNPAGKEAFQRSLQGAVLYGEKSDQDRYVVLFHAPNSAFALTTRVRGELSSAPAQRAAALRKFLADVSLVLQSEGLLTGETAILDDGIRVAYSRRPPENRDWHLLEVRVTRANTLFVLAGFPLPPDFSANAPDPKLDPDLDVILDFIAIEPGKKM